MYDNLGELVSAYPIGAKIRIMDKDRDDYERGRFIVEGYLYDGAMWYPAHQISNGDWEIFKK